MSPASAPRPLLIPVENQIRELESKLLLASVAAERGFPVILGARSALHLAIGRLPRGRYLAKSLAESSERIFAIMNGLGHEIVAWVDDALVRFPDEPYFETRLSPSAFRRASRLFAWGEENADLFRRYHAYHGAPIHVTGNPRVDLLRPELRPYFSAEVEAIRSRFGDFVLVNTNFSKLNHYLPERAAWTRAAASGATSGTDAFLAGAAAHRRIVFSHFQQMIPWLAASLPDTAIVVRPHPVEDPAPWHALAARHGNVHVVLEGTVVPWLLASRVLVHNACTTAVEAFLMDVPTVSYQPIEASDRFDPELTRWLGERVSDLDELAARAGSALVGSALARERVPVRDAEQWKRLERHVAAFEGRLASDRIVDVLAETEAAGGAPPRRLGRYLHGRLHAGVRATSKRLARGRARAAYQRHRFPALRAEHLEERVRRLGRALGRFERLRIRPLARDLFEIDGR